MMRCEDWQNLTGLVAFNGQTKQPARRREWRSGRGRRSPSIVVDSCVSSRYSPIRMNEFVRAPIAALLTSLLVCPLRSQQAAPLPPLSPAASEIRAKVNALPIGGKLTVNMIDGNQYCGDLQRLRRPSKHRGGDVIPAGG